MNITDNNEFRMTLFNAYYKYASKFNHKIFIEVLVDEEVKRDNPILDHYAKDSNVPGVRIVTLNICPLATNNSVMSNEESISFNSRFNGQSYCLFLTINKIIRIFIPNENTPLLTFPVPFPLHDPDKPKELTGKSNVTPLKSKKPSLQVVK